MLPSSEETLKLRWLIRVRWCAFIGLFLAFAIGRWIAHLTLSAYPFMLVILALPLTNIVAGNAPLLSAKNSSKGLIVLDVILLTILLYSYGGSTNPLSSVYFLHVILASMLLPSLWAWGIATLCSLCFSILFFAYIPLPELSGGHEHHHAFSTHLQGMLATFVCTSLVLVYFISALADALRKRERELEALKDATQKNERLASLTTLAASAAHELRNPLASISLSISELELALRKITNNQDILTESASIKSAVDRCLAIIRKLGNNAGITPGEPLVNTTVNTIVSRLSHSIPENAECTFDIPADVAGTPIKTFVDGLTQALLSLLKNGLEYGKVTVRAHRSNQQLTFTISDCGPGLPEHVRTRIGEPFFSTKPNGAGMGLGVFISKTFVERLNGSLSYSSIPSGGTQATLTIPTMP